MAEITYESNHWREEVVNSVFKFFAIFGMFPYIPSMYLSIIEKLPVIAVMDTLVYGACIFLAIDKKVPTHFKGVFGTSLFWILGIILLINLGPVGAGEIWLFSATVISALLLGEKGAITTFILSLCAYVSILLLLDRGIIDWEIRFGITKGIWLTKSLNTIILNFAVVIINSIYLRAFKSILSRTSETRNATILGLAKLAEYRDSATGEHLSRIQELTVLVAFELSKRDKYREYITDAYLSDLKISSILHDIGKVGIHDSILLKNGPLTEEEFNIIKTHPAIGEEAIGEIEKNINGRSLFHPGERDSTLSS